MSFCLLKDCGSQCLSANPLGGCRRFGISRHPQAAARDLQASNQLFAAKICFSCGWIRKTGAGDRFFESDRPARIGTRCSGPAVLARHHVCFSGVQQRPYWTVCAFWGVNSHKIQLIGVKSHVIPICKMNSDGTGPPTPRPNNKKSRFHTGSGIHQQRSGARASRHPPRWHVRSDIARIRVMNGGSGSGSSSIRFFVSGIWVGRQGGRCGGQVQRREP